MGKRIELVQRNGGKWRYNCRHLMKSAGRRVYLHLGKVEAKARAYAPFIDVAVRDCSTPDEAHEVCRKIMAAPDENAARQTLGRIINNRLKSPIVPPEDRMAQAREKVESFDINPDDHPDLVNHFIDTSWKINTEYLARHPELRPNIWTRLFEGAEAAEKMTEQQATEKANETRLSDCLELWKDRKEEKRCNEYIKATETAFKIFMDKIGNLPVMQLTAQHFEGYETFLLKTKGKRKLYFHQQAAQ